MKQVFMVDDKKFLTRSCHLLHVCVFPYIFISSDYIYGKDASECLFATSELCGLIHFVTSNLKHLTQK